MSLAELPTQPAPPPYIKRKNSDTFNLSNLLSSDSSKPQHTPPSSLTAFERRDSFTSHTTSNEYRAPHSSSVSPSSDHVAAFSDRRSSISYLPRHHTSSSSGDRPLLPPVHYSRRNSINGQLPSLSQLVQNHHQKQTSNLMQLPTSSSSNANKDNSKRGASPVDYGFSRNSTAGRSPNRRAFSISTIPEAEKLKKVMPPVNDEDETDPRGVYRCTHEGCGKYFTRRYNLMSHLRVHSDMKPFPCLLCPAEFRRKHDFRRHIRSLHSVEKPHQCQYCSLSFARSDALKRHLISESKRDSSTHPKMTI